MFPPLGLDKHWFPRQPGDSALPSPPQEVIFNHVIILSLAPLGPESGFLKQ